jgi:hypothetical protein
MGFKNTKQLIQTLICAKKVEICYFKKPSNLIRFVRFKYSKTLLKIDFPVLPRIFKSRINLTTPGESSKTSTHSFQPLASALLANISPAVIL